MIRVVLGRPEDHVTEAAVRPVTSALDGTSIPSRDLADGAGMAIAARLWALRASS